MSACLLLVGVWKLFEMRNEKESTKMKNLAFVRNYVASPNGQREIVAWCEQLRAELGNRESWKNAVMANNQWASQMTPNNAMAILKITDELAPYMAAGHDQGHRRRDKANAIMFFDDTPGLPADKWSGLFSAIDHDISNAVCPRYADKKRNASHAMVGAYWYNMLMEDVFPEGFRRMVCYGIMIHGFALAPIKTTEPDEVTIEPFWRDVWLDAGNIYGAGTVYPTNADRGETCAVTQLFRHLISRCDAAEDSGMDILGGNWDSLTTDWIHVGGDGLTATFLPQMDSPFLKTATTFAVMRSYEKSFRTPGLAYPAFDHTVPAFARLTAFKFDQMNTIIAAAQNLSITPMTLGEIEVAFRHVSGADASRFDPSWEFFKAVWATLTDEQQLAWGRVFREASKAYDELLSFYLKSAANSSLATMMRKTVAELLLQ